MVKTKVNKNIGVVRKIINDLPRNTLHLLYYTLIHPYFSYSNMIWACQDNVHTQSLYRLQNKGISLVTLAPWNSHSGPIFKILNILNIFYIKKITSRMSFVYIYLTGLLPFHWQTIILESLLST